MDGEKLVLNSYGTSIIDLRSSFLNTIKKICTDKLVVNKEIDETSLEYRLLHLEKKLSLSQVGMCDVLQRIAEKLVVKIAKLTKTVGSLQLCAGQDVRSEAAIHPMHSIFEANETESTLLVDAENAFSSVNWKLLLHNV